MASIRARLTGTYTLALVGTMLVFSATLWFTRRLAGYRELQRYVVEEAAVATQLIRQAVGPGLPLTEVKDSLAGPRVVKRVELLLDALPNIVILTDTARRILYASIEARLLTSSSVSDLRTGAEQLSPTASGIVPIVRDSANPVIAANMRARALPGQERVLMVRVDVPPDLAPLRSVIVATATTQSDRATREPFGTLLAIAPIILLFSIGSAYYIAGNALRPIDFVTTELGAITDGRSLHRRLPGEEGGGGEAAGTSSPDSRSPSTR